MRCEVSNSEPMAIISASSIGESGAITGVITGIQGLLEVGHDIFGGFDPDGKADQIVANTELLAAFGEAK